MRAILVTCALFAIVGPTWAQSLSVEGEVLLTHGFITDARGVRIPIQGLRLPFVAKPIVARKVTVPDIFAHVQPGPAPQATVYLNNNGNGTYYYAPENPSSLDDLVLSSAGNGQPWKTLEFGIDAQSPNKFLVRWIMFDDFVQNRGPGVSAFDNVLADFGGFITLPVGTWDVTVNIAIVGCVIPDGEFYMAQQFREPDPTGEGAFNTAFSTVFSGGGPTVGSSEDICFMDWPTPDGIYDETEVDNFGGPPNQANFLTGIVTGGTVSDRQVGSLTVERGEWVSGDTFSTFDSDNEYYQVNAGPINGLSPISVIMTSQSPVTSPTSYTFTIETSVTNPTFTMQVLELYNYAQNKWIVYDTRPVPTQDTKISVVAQPQPSQYVNASNRQIRARVRFTGKKPVAIGTPKARLNLDWATWRIVSP